MTCKECLYYEVCPLGLAVKGKTGTCLKFKNKADFVELVRCKGCKFVHINSSSGLYHCKRRGHYSEEVKRDDFCSYGERSDT